MATRARVAELPTTEAGGESPGPLLGRSQGGGSLGSGVLRLSPGRGPFTWAIHPARLGCRHGRIVPLVVPVWHEAGIDGNLTGDQGAGYMSTLRRQGFVEIDHSRPAVAFGEQRKAPPLPSTYARRLVGVDMDGRQCVRWVDAWTRPLQLGDLTEWETDQAGKDEFLEAAMLELCATRGELVDAQIRLAVQPLITRIISESERDTPRARMLIRSMAAHLPPAHVPDVVRDILDRITPARPA